MKKKFIIAIDGPAGAGKSTIAKMLARRLRYTYIDSGAMYRALTWKAMHLGLALTSAGKLVSLARKSRLEFMRQSGRIKLFLDGHPVGREIRTPQVTENICHIADNQDIRKIMVKIQQHTGRNGGVVMEGRDIGSKVFPGAEFKFYLDASVAERARRRYLEFRARGIKEDRQAILRDIRIRDRKDRSRPVSPLVKVPDAMVIDSSHLTREQVVAKMLARIRREDR
jgi:CMP/dCMP kinase